MAQNQGPSSEQLLNALAGQLGVGQNKDPGMPKATLSEHGLYQHPTLPIRDSDYLYGDSKPSDKPIMYSQAPKEAGAAERDFDVPEFYESRDPRFFVAKDQSNITNEMRLFFKKGTRPKGSLKDGSTRDHLQFLLQQAPTREIPETSYLHDALAHPTWTKEEKREAIRMMMAYNFDPNREWASEFPIERAVRMGDESIVGTLLQSGAHVHVQDKEGFNLLSTAVASGNSALIPLLMRHGVEPKTTASGDTLLQLALERFEERASINPGDAIREFHDSIVHLQRFRVINEGHIKGQPLIPETRKRKMPDGQVVEEPTVEAISLERIKSKLPADYYGMYHDALHNLNLADKYEKEEIAALRSSTPSRVEPVANPGMVQAKQSVRSHTTGLFGIKGITAGLWAISDYVNDKAMAKFETAMFEDIFSAKSDADFEERLKFTSFNVRFAPHPVSLYDVAIPRMRDTIDLDKPNPKFNGDTIVHHAIRAKSAKMLDFCMRENCNLHAVNQNGDYPVHLVAEMDKADVKTMKNLLTKMVGRINPATGVRESLYDGGKLVDMRVLNAKGQNFLEVIKEKHGLDFAMEIAHHLELHLDQDKGRGISPNMLKLNMLPPVMTVAERTTPVMALGNGVKYSEYLNIDPNTEIPKVRKVSGVETEQELADFYQKKSNDIYKIVAMLRSSDVSDDKREELATALKATLDTTPMNMRVGILMASVADLPKNNEGWTQMNDLHKSVYDRVLRDTAERLKNPANADEMLKELEFKTPDGKAHAMKVVSAIAAVEGDINAMGLSDKINTYISDANENRFKGDPNYKAWYEQTGGLQPKQPE